MIEVSLIEFFSSYLLVSVLLLSLLWFFSNWLKTRRERGNRIIGCRLCGGEIVSLKEGTKGMKGLRKKRLARGRMVVCAVCGAKNHAKTDQIVT